MRFLLDHNVPASVANVLRERGHTCILLVDVVPTDSTDPVVARVAEINDCILVTQDSDFRQIIKRIPDGAKSTVKRLSRISLQCQSFNCAKRIGLAMSFIEHEWELCQEARDKRMFLFIGHQSMRTSR
jgi:predicted nuclease of predicted toxin-antitoxin system